MYGSVTVDGVIIDDRCCFGSAADATKCCRVSNMIVHYARKAMQEFDDAHPSRVESVLEYQRRRRALGVAAGCDEDEIKARWSCLFNLGMFVDDAATASIDDMIYQQNQSKVQHAVHQEDSFLMAEKSLEDLDGLIGYIIRLVVHL